MQSRRTCFALIDLWDRHVSFLRRPKVWVRADYQKGCVSPSRDRVRPRKGGGGLPAWREVGTPLMKTMATMCTWLREAALVYSLTRHGVGSGLQYRNNKFVDLLIFIWAKWTYHPCSLLQCQWFLWPRATQNPASLGIPPWFQLLLSRHNQCEFLGLEQEHSGALFRNLSGEQHVSIYNFERKNKQATCHKMWICTIIAKTCDRTCFMLWLMFWQMFARSDGYCPQKKCNIFKTYWWMNKLSHVCKSRFAHSYKV